MHCWILFSLNRLVSMWKKEEKDVHYSYFLKRMLSRIGTVVMDEGHRLRNTHTNFFQSIKHLGAEYHWLLTATPVINLTQVLLPYRFQDKRTNRKTIGYSWTVNLIVASRKTSNRP